jgi:quercetin dioxygenase-like cupin family protein
MQQGGKMGIVKSAEVVPEEIAPGRRRYLAHTDKLMMVVIDFYDGPTDQPDPPHTHPHEQVSYVASGEVIFFLGDEPHRLGPGDIYSVPPDVPHSVQLLTEHVRLVDTFHPIRQEFLSSQ